MKQIGSPKAKESNLGLVAAGITGAIIGAGVAVVATVAMKDEKTKKQIRDISMTFYDQVKEYVRKSNLTNPTYQKKTIKKLGDGIKKARKSS